MSEQLKESLSAVMDGEADEFEIRRVLNEAADDSELRGVWERYHLVSSVIRGEGRKRGARTLGREFWAQIDADDATTNSEVVPVDAPPDTARGAPRWAWVSASRWWGRCRCCGSRRHRFWRPRDWRRRRHTGRGLADAGLQVQQSDIQTTPAAFDDDDQPVDDVYPSSLDLQRAQAYMLHHAHQVALTNQTRTVPFVKVAAFQSR
jgi:hypothetical protein